MAVRNKMAPSAFFGEKQHSTTQWGSPLCSDTHRVLCREQAPGLSPSPLCKPLPRLRSRACSLRLKVTLCHWVLALVFACTMIWGRLSICLKFTCLVCLSVSHTAVALCIVAAAAVGRDFSFGMYMRVWDEWNSSPISILLNLLFCWFFFFIILPAGRTGLWLKCSS